jgi:hypothetical protein
LPATTLVALSGRIVVEGIEMDRDHDGVAVSRRPAPERFRREQQVADVL